MNILCPRIVGGPPVIYIEIKEMLISTIRITSNQVTISLIILEVFFTRRLLIATTVTFVGIVACAALFILVH